MDISWFMNSSINFIISIWNGISERKRDELNYQSIATAKLSLLIELGFSGLGGNADSVKMDINRYLALPKEDPLVANNRGKISKDAGQYFWYLWNKLPGYVQKAFLQNKELMVLLQELKYKQ